MKNLLLLLIFLCTVPLSAQSGTFRIDFDYARFYYSDSAGYLEIYYSFMQAGLTREVQDTSVVIRGFLDVKITGVTDKEFEFVKEYQFRNAYAKEDSASISGSLMGVMGYVLPFGEYKLTLGARDATNPEFKASFEYGVFIHPLPENLFTISDIQLASNIKRGEDETSLFYKNTYEVTPNPTLLFGESLPVLYYYTEFYNVNKNVQSEVLKIEQNIINSKDQFVYRKSKYTRRSNPSIVEAGAINIFKLPSGAYTLVLSIADTISNNKALVQKRFFVYNPTVIDTSSQQNTDLDFYSSEFSGMSDEEVEMSFKYVRYICTKDELSRWQSLTTVDAKKNYLYNFWKSRDNITETPENEYKREYYKRLNYSNDHFKSFQKRGWETDRGRIHMSYGEPSEIERYPNQVDTKPYEVWTYHNIEGGVIFVFGDLTGYADYTLLHSTHRGELRDENWLRRIQSLNK
ncbi:MAG: hypothetical protein AMXMBFR48_13790 [Ignavibacteriales bacterium]